ncbi:MAG: helix-turn-helix domain-containing protein [Neptuniibacter sp.]
MSSRGNDFLTNFGERLKEARKAKNRTQQEIATHLGIGKNAISRYERGEVEPGALALSMISCYLEVSPDWLLHGDFSHQKSKNVTSEKERRYETPEQSLFVVLKIQDLLQLSLTAGQLQASLEFTFKAQADEKTLELFLLSAHKFAESKVSKQTN